MQYIKNMHKKHYATKQKRQCNTQIKIKNATQQNKKATKKKKHNTTTNLKSVK